MDEKLAFMVDYLRGEWSMAAPCEEYGISRKTGYKLVARYRVDGPEGLVGRSRASRCYACAMVPTVADAIFAQCPGVSSLGPRKLRAVLMREYPEGVWPAASTMGDLLRGEGLVSSRRCCRSIVLPMYPVAQRTDIRACIQRLDGRRFRRQAPLQWVGWQRRGGSRDNPRSGCGSAVNSLPIFHLPRGGAWTIPTRPSSGEGIR